MAKRERYLSDEKWSKIEPLLPPRQKGRGRPRANDRDVLEGILWILRTGAPWKELPPEYPSPSTCWRRLKEWEEQEIWLDIWRSFLSQLDADGALDWSEAFLDGSFAPAKKGANVSVPPKGARGQSGWWWSTARAFLWEAPLPRHHRQK